MKRTRAVIVGYLGDVMQCHILANWLQRVRALNPQIKIYIDPVMGDYGEGSTWMSASSTAIARRSCGWPTA